MAVAVSTPYLNLPHRWAFMPANQSPQPPLSMPEALSEARGTCPSWVPRIDSPVSLFPLLQSTRPLTEKELQQTLADGLNSRHGANKISRIYKNVSESDGGDIDVENASCEVRWQFWYVEIILAS